MLARSPEQRIPLRDIMRDEWVMRNLEGESTCDKLSMKNSENSANNSLVQCRSQGWIRKRESGNGKTMSKSRIGSLSLSGKSKASNFWKSLDGNASVNSFIQ